MMNKILQTAIGSMVLVLAVATGLFVTRSPQLGVRVVTQNPKLSISITTAKESYSTSDTIVIQSEFSGDSLARIQLADEGGGGLYFYVVISSLDEPSRISCDPIWRYQFVKWAEVRGTLRVWLEEVGIGLKRQLVLHLPRYGTLPPGRYHIRVGYARDGRKLLPLVSKIAGPDITVEEILTEKLEGAYEEAVLSAPLPITVVADKVPPERK